MKHDLIESLTKVLEFYKEFGFESLPLEIEFRDKTNAPELRFQAPNSKLLTPNSPFGKDAALDSLREEIGDCQRCKLSRGRTHIVFGEGSAHAEIMFIGEAPGSAEDLQARPFVGDAGRLLTRLIEKMGIRREDVYIANIVKCRPPANRDPQEDEMLICSTFLDRQIEIISPEVIISLGKISAYVLLKIKIPISKFSIARTRGRFSEYKGVPIMPTFHPAYLLRNPKAKWLVWEDMQVVLKKLGKKRSFVSIEGE